MDDAGPDPEDQHVGDDDHAMPSEAGLTLENYALGLGLPVDWLKAIGLSTIDNPWAPGRAAVAIPYRQRDGSPFRNRIRQAVRPFDTKRSRTLWDRRPEKLGALLYGLDRLPAPGCPLMLVDDEAACQLLWHRGFDAIATQGAGGYVTSRDDPELSSFSITVIATAAGGLLKRLTRSRHRKRITVATLDGFADLIALHRQSANQFVAVVNAAIAKAKPLIEVAPVLTDVKTQSGATGEGNSPLDGTIADNLVTLARRDGRVFIADDGSAWADVRVNGRRETWSLKSRGFKNWLVHTYYAATGRAPSPDALNQALLTLDASARYDGVSHSVRVRTGAFGDCYYLDLADADWRAVEISAAGWRVVSEPPIRFARPRGMSALPEPVRGGSLAELRDFLNLAGDTDCTLVIAWLLAALRPVGPYPLLAIAGEPGASKSTTARVLRSLTDPNISALRSAPREERDCWIAASNSGMLAFDNLSSIPGWLSDALCRIATGGGYATRQLHTDDDEILFDSVRPTLITSVSDVIARSDLADRAILIELPPIPEDRRQPEEEFNARLEAARPRILGALLDAMVVGMRNRGAVRLTKLPRLADFATWATACEPSFTHEGGVMTAYAENHRETVTSVLEGDVVCVALLKFLDAQSGSSQQGYTWTGTAEALLAQLATHAPAGATRSGWPVNPQALSGRLRMSARNLAQVGVSIERGRTKAARFIRISRGVGADAAQP
jgi:hypothetical protein